MPLPLQNRKHSNKFWLNCAMGNQKHDIGLSVFPATLSSQTGHLPVVSHDRAHNDVRRNFVSAQTSFRQQLH